MWHLKTRLGTFWVMEGEEIPLKNNANHKNHKYYLGIDDNKLGEYSDAATAAKDVYQQATGYLQWDCQSRIKVPKSIEEWEPGEPKEWL